MQSEFLQTFNRQFCVFVHAATELSKNCEKTVKNVQNNANFKSVLKPQKMNYSLSVDLYRDGVCSPWGFRLKGGIDVDGGTPLEIIKVSYFRREN